MNMNFFKTGKNKLQYTVKIPKNILNPAKSASHRKYIHQAKQYKVITVYNKKDYRKMSTKSISTLYILVTQLNNRLNCF